jgi:putative flavoprotein involved in K+ transport
VLDCLIIGAGHSGMTCAGLLAQRGLAYAIVDAGARVGDVWRLRPRNLRLFTSRRFCRVLGEPMDGDPEGYASAAEFGDYLAAVAGRRGITPCMSTRVSQLTRDHASGFRIDLDNGSTLLAKTVIDATGSNQAGHRAAFAGDLAGTVRQLAGHEYRSEADFQRGQRIVVVGDGASGRQIAAELAVAGHTVAMARGRRRNLLPQRLLGRDIFHWLTASRLLFADRQSSLGRIIRARDPIPLAALSDAALNTLGVELAGRAIGAREDVLHMDDGSKLRCAAVIWCGGYVACADWIYLPAIASTDDLLVGRGITAEPGFYVVGRKWLSCRASELILGAERDCRRVVDHLTAFRQRPGRPVIRAMT